MSPVRRYRACRYAPPPMPPPAGGARASSDGRRAPPPCAPAPWRRQRVSRRGRSAQRHGMQRPRRKLLAGAHGAVISTRLWTVRFSSGAGAAGAWRANCRGVPHPPPLPFQLLVLALDFEVSKRGRRRGLRRSAWRASRYTHRRPLDGGDGGFDVAWPEMMMTTDGSSLGPSKHST